MMAGRLEAVGGFWLGVLARRSLASPSLVRHFGAAALVSRNLRAPSAELLSSSGRRHVRGRVTVLPTPMPEAGNPTEEANRRRSAVHEAGHAVFAHLLCIPLEGVALHAGDGSDGGALCTPKIPGPDPSIRAWQRENWACMALGGREAEMLEYRHADPNGLLRDSATFWTALRQHPAVSSGLVAEIMARASELLRAPDARSAVDTLAAALERASALDGAAVEKHLRKLPRSQWALARSS